MNDLLDDAPIDHISNDELGYSDIVKKITRTLRSQYYNKSFTIGLVGPWGNGKSSIINLVETDLHQANTLLYKLLNRFNLLNKEEIITIHFLPYLNHKEEDIINEFFIALSNKLSKYNGKLSNQILDYSQKLTNLYKDKKIFDFFDNHVSKIDSTPAKELYDDINSRLKEINKKIVVFVDDLDRLNENEILQVLKLIRNTADFRNTFFLVAMDKDYVISRLKKNSEILNSKFIDKFFQLEIYLPELEPSVLKKFLVKELVNSSLNSNGNFEIKLKDAVDNKYNLFEDYVRNFRDVKRIINQIIFEYPFFQNELDLKDFMNFIYFKLRFPKLVKVLNDNRNQLLDVSGEDKQYKLKTIEKPSDRKEIGISSEKMFIAINRMNSNYVPLEKYLLYEQLKIKDIDLNDLLNIDKEDYNLLIKTLACLFGEENEIKNTTSIKFENNFRKLMQQKYLETDLLEYEFRELYENHKEIPKVLIENLYSVNKIQQLLKRFDYFNSEKDYDIRRTIVILAFLYEKREDFSLFEHEILRLLAVFVQKHLDINRETTWIKNNIFEDNLLSGTTKLRLLGKLWDSKGDNNLWDIEENYIFELTLFLFKKYIDEKKNDIPAFNDYKIYAVYHSIKNIGKLINDIKSIFLEYWTSDKNEILSVHLIEMDSFTKSLFKISDVATELYGSYSNFIEHIKNTSIIPNEGLKEIILFLDLREISRHNGYTVFDFQNSIPMREKINSILNSNGRSTYDGLDNMSQVFFELSDKEFANKVLDDVDLRNYYNLKISQYDNKWYIYSTLNRIIKKDDILTMAKEIYKHFVNTELVQIDDNKVLNRENFIPENINKFKSKLYSVQPFPTK